ncbi:uncharacterized protein YbaR (Trm112 family) [Natronocella acetinitrilica]|uniref:Uncharacterized protein YbaR (Trm112 family) n=1 Tax=Natronocella acetinitrilica TaxID=414046 RepID=A0AAE3G310_9GAMM|nr:Trm112 family protein [Natronocella acetinitrilica]MCP1672957.1 uncharacterized protein YbaR (Trm112 family) [Natronocella acetinitrilica]
MALDQSLLDILVCPVTKKPLRRMDRKALKRLTEAAEASRLQFADGSPVSGPIAEALISDDGERIYLVDDGIPVLLEDRAISAESLQGVAG